MTTEPNPRPIRIGDAITGWVDSDDKQHDLEKPEQVRDIDIWNAAVYTVGSGPGMRTMGKIGPRPTASWFFLNADDIKNRPGRVVKRHAIALVVAGVDCPVPIPAPKPAQSRGGLLSMSGESRQLRSAQETR